jgi:hypothetical protein
VQAQEIPQEQWSEFFDAFSARHEGAQVSIEVMGAEIGDQRLGHGLRLRGASFDRGDEQLALMFETASREDFAHAIAHPTHIWLDRGDGRADQTLQVEAADGTRTLVAIRAQ